MCKHEATATHTNGAKQCLICGLWIAIPSNIARIFRSQTYAYLFEYGDYEEGELRPDVVAPEFYRERDRK